MVVRKPSVRLVHAQPGNLQQIGRWLAQSDIRRWWGSPVENLREMRVAIGASPQQATVFLIFDKYRQQVGFVSLLHARLIANTLGNWSRRLPLDAWEIGILIHEVIAVGRSPGQEYGIEY